MDFGYRTHAYGDLPIEKMFRHIKASGYTSVELCLENAELSLSRLDGSHIGRVRKDLKAIGLKPCAVSIHADYVHSLGAYHDIVTAIPLVPELGSHMVVIFSGMEESRRLKDDWKVLVTKTKSLLHVAKAYDVSLAIEPAPRSLVKSAEEAKKLLEECSSRLLGLVFNTGNAFLSEDDPMKAIETLASHIIHVHVDDLKRRRRVHVPPGEGDVAVKEMLAALTAAGYDGHLVVDLPGLDPHYAAPRAFQSLKKMLER